jgi:acyl carrier protein
VKIDRAELVSVVGLTLGSRNVRESDKLLEDLGLESADLLNLLIAVEDRFGVAIDELEALELTTVAELGDLIERRMLDG